LTDQLILDLINQIEPKLFFLFIKLFLAALILFLLKSFLDNLVAYIQFLLNKHLNIGVHVMVRNQKGIISYFNTRYIFVRTPTIEILIPIRRWQNEQWALIKEEPK